MWWRSKHTHFTSQSACHSGYPCCRGMNNAYYVCCLQILLHIFCACLTHLFFQTLRKQVTHISQHVLMRLKHEKKMRHNKNRFRKRVCDRRVTEKRQILWWALYNRFRVISTVVLYPLLLPERLETGYIHPLIFYRRENIAVCLKLDNLLLLSREA
jgi:hypothetical protein